MVITAALTAAAAGHPQKSIRQMKWRDIEYQLTELKAYDLERPPISNVTVRLMVEHSLKSCRELGLGECRPVAGEAHDRSKEPLLQQASASLEARLGRGGGCRTRFAWDAAQQLLRRRLHGG